MQYPFQFQRTQIGLFTLTNNYKTTILSNNKMNALNKNSCLFSAVPPLINDQMSQMCMFTVQMFSLITHLLGNPQLLTMRFPPVSVVSHTMWLLRKMKHFQCTTFSSEQEQEHFYNFKDNILNFIMPVFLV